MNTGIPHNSLNPKCVCDRCWRKFWVVRYIQLWAAPVVLIVSAVAMFLITRRFL